ncbi:trypsin-3-like [Armigeres subalbatus]|uniref:trypsin-3-like n=1 Tax=Armigeres subalbatus TaxID=124917 RepID=UPI002ED66DF6
MNNVKLLTLFAVAICRALSEPVSATNRIVNGSTVDIVNYPYQVAIIAWPNTDEEIGYAGGTLIADTWVLSAAHLFRSKRASHTGVRVGSSEVNEGGTVIEVAGLSYHPNYNPNNVDNDYVLLRLKQPYRIDPVARAIPMVDDGEVTADGTVCTASGWGDTMGTGNNDTLQAVEVPIVNHSQCKKNYAASKLSITDSMLCAGYDEGMQDSCTGDSGGPLVCQGKLVGVVSWGRKCASKNFYGVYANVAKARDWIKRKTGV